MMPFLRAAAVVASLALAACGTAALHSSQDYANAAAVGDPDGSLTTIVGPNTEIVNMTSTVKFPQGDTSAVRSVLMYVAPGSRPGTCTFQIGHLASHTFTIVKEDKMERPCDGKRWASFRIAGTDVGFVAHLTSTNYKGTPVTLLEISDHKAPDSLRLVY
jgi:hypothetical protein